MGRGMSGKKKTKQYRRKVGGRFASQQITFVHLKFCFVQVLKKNNNCFSLFFSLVSHNRCQTHKWGREAAVCFFFLRGLWVNLCLLKFSLTDSCFVYVTFILRFVQFNECYAFFVLFVSHFGCFLNGNFIDQNQKYNLFLFLRASLTILVFFFLWGKTKTQEIIRQFYLSLSLLIR